MNWNNLELPDKPYYSDDAVIIYHADCRDILPLIPDKSIDLVLTDPPYGIGIKYGGNYDDNPKEYWQWFLPVVEQMIKIGKITIFTHRNGESQRHIQGWDWMGVWNKPVSFGARIGNSAILPHWEPIYFYGIHSAGVYGEYCPDVLTFNPVKAGGSSLIGREKWQNAESFKKHPAPKPIGLFQKLAQTFSPDKGIILDPFLGSGTTAYCAKKLNRKCIGIEIEEKYCEIAAKRCSQSVMRLEV
jgi:site-specific DNA-methyltransferase (adenine-specific)